MAEPIQGRKPARSRVKGAILFHCSKWFLPVAILLLGSIELFSIRSEQESKVYAEHVNSDLSVVKHVADFLTALDEAEGSQRGFLLTGEQGYLRSYNLGRERATAELASLVLATEPYPKQHARAEAIRRLTARRFELFDSVIERFRSGGYEAASTFIRTGVGERIMNEIRPLGQLIEFAGNTELKQRLERAEEYQTRAFLTTAAGSTSLFILLTLSLIVIRSADRQRDRRHLLELRDQAMILDLANDTILLRDEEDRITYWNKGSERLYGFNKDQALGQVSHILLKTKFPEPQNAIRTHLLSQGHWHGELVHTARDGSPVNVVSNWTLRRDYSDQSVSVLEINYDVTARKKAEEQLEKYGREMAERSAQLEIANRELEQFAYVASHDLKAPLRVIDNASKWLEEDLQEHLTDDTREAMDLLRGRVKRMEKLLDDLLEYARIGRATDNRYAETVQGDVLMKDILALLAPNKFTVKVSPNFAAIQPRRMPLQQILMNLIDNAIKHHHRQEGCIEVTVEDQGECYAFSVKDDGPGIPAQFQEQIFQMFQTLRPRDQVEGSGMGLTMVRKAVEVFGGTLQLESAEGQGSVFRFTWPKQQKVSRAAA